MNPIRKTLFAAALAGGLFTAAVSPAWASPTAYQATGTVLSMTDTSITIMKGKEKWEIATTSAPADVKVGDKVTVHYTMTASSIDAPKAAPAAAAKGKDKKSTKTTAAKAAASPAAAPANGAPDTTEVQKPAAESGPAASPATTPGQ